MKFIIATAANNRVVRAAFNIKYIIARTRRNRNILTANLKGITRTSGSCVHNMPAAKQNNIVTARSTDNRTVLATAAS